MLLPPDLSTEVVVNLLMKHGLVLDDFLFIFEGSFRRNYLNDLHKVDQINSYSNRPTYMVYLNRDGIYDKLPEGLFHRIDRFVKPEKSGELKTFKEEYEQQKNEIIGSKKFFQPIENEFFRKRVLREAALSDSFANPFRTVYRYFFSGKSRYELNEKFTESVTSFLPAVRNFRGNLSKIRFFLISILQTNVRIEQCETLAVYPNNDPTISKPLGESILGKDFYPGRSFTDHRIQWNINIHANNDSLHYYLENGDYRKFFGFVKTNLIPAGVEAEFNFHISETTDFLLQGNNDAKTAMYLGYNTCI
ncbi:MAG: hypothetical protein V1775_08275 [Bacteroidota bacterium]